MNAPRPARHPGLSGSSAPAPLVEEALRMDVHPGIASTDGPTGRRAAVFAGPDVWEVIRSLRSARETEPELTGDDVVDLLSDATGLPAVGIGVALDYYSAYPDEIDAEIAVAMEAEREAEVRLADPGKCDFL